MKLPLLSKSSIQSQEGASLIELMLVTVMVGFMVVLIAGIPNSMVLIGKSQHLSVAKEVATKQLSAERALAYSNLNNGSTLIRDSRLSLLPSSSGSITVEDCNPAVCTNAEPVKLVTVLITWRDNAKDQSYQLQTMIASGGLGR